MAPRKSLHDGSAPVLTGTSAELLRKSSESYNVCCDKTVYYDYKSRRNYDVADRAVAVCATHRSTLRAQRHSLAADFLAASQPFQPRQSFHAEQSGAAQPFSQDL